MTGTEAADAAIPAAPALLDVVRTRLIFAPHHSHPRSRDRHSQAVAHQARHRYRVEFRGGITEWFWRDELTVQPWAAERDIVHTDLTAARTVLHHAITTAEGHDVLHVKLGELFDLLTATANTYLGGTLDVLSRVATPAD